MNTGAEIDSASFRQIVQLYDRPISEIYPWSWKTAVEVTKLLIFASDNISLAPGPSAPKDAREIDGNPYQIEFRLAAAKVLPSSPARELDADTRNAAVSATESWLGPKENPASENLKWLMEAATAVQADSENGQLWLDWVWHRIEHIHQSTVGLFRSDYLAQYASVLGVSESELERLQLLSQQTKNMARIGFRGSSEGKMIEKLFLADAMVRTIFHEAVAKSLRRQITAHPLRQLFRLVCVEKPSSYEEYSVSAFENYVSNIVVSTSFAERKVADRLSLFCANVLAVRRWFANPANRRNEDAMSIDSAVDCVRTVPEFRFVSKPYQDTLERVAKILPGVVVTTSLLVLPIGGPSEGTRDKMLDVLVKLGIGRVANAMVSPDWTKQKVMELAPTRRGRLKELASGSWGRLVSKHGEILSR